MTIERRAAAHGEDIGASVRSEELAEHIVKFMRLADRADCGGFSLIEYPLSVRSAFSGASFQQPAAPSNRRLSTVYPSCSRGEELH